MLFTFQSSTELDHGSTQRSSTEKRSYFSGLSRPHSAPHNPSRLTNILKSVAPNSARTEKSYERRGSGHDLPPKPVSQAWANVSRLDLHENMITTTLFTESVFVIFLAKVNVVTPSTHWAWQDAESLHVFISSIEMLTHSWDYEANVNPLETGFVETIYIQPFAH